MSSPENTNGEETFDEDSFQETKPFPCSMCKEVFTEEADWLDHISNHMSVNDDVKPFLCQKCDLIFEQEDEYNNHVALHNHSEALFCSACKVVLMHDHSSNQCHDTQGKTYCASCFLDHGLGKASEPSEKPSAGKRKVTPKKKKDKNCENVRKTKQKC